MEVLLMLAAVRTVESSPRPWLNLETPAGHLQLSPANHLLHVEGVSLLVNPDSGSWLRLSRTGKLLMQSFMKAAAASGKLSLNDTLPPADQLSSFFEALKRGHFASSPETPSAARTFAAHQQPDSASASNPMATVVLNVTHRCNLRCSHCAVYSQATNGGGRAHLAAAQRTGEGASSGQRPEPTTAEMKDLISRLARKGTRKLILFGGEPTMRRDICDLIRFSQDKIPELAISTNGTLLTDKICRTIKDVASEVTVSLDGACPEVHDRIRGAGSYRRAVAGIERLRKIGHPKVALKSVISRFSRDDAPRMVRLARSLDAELELSPFQPLGLGAGTANQLQLSSAELLDVYKRVWLLAEYYQVPSASFNLFCDRFMARAGRSCAPGRSYVLVDCSGEVYPCEGLQYQQLRMGNAYEEAEIGKAEDLAFDPSVDKLPGCASCNIRYICKGGCAAEAYVAGDTSSAASSLCGFYSLVLPRISARYEPRCSSWRNLKRVFGDTVELSILKDYI
jgi:radical SAM protein with 4Fe4S-binding SPASM domain